MSPTQTDPTSVRKKILEIIHKSSASHIGSSFSVVEILCAIYSRVDLAKIKAHSPDRDRVVVSKGHSAAALYATLNAFGLLSDADAATYYTNGSLLGGHVSHAVPHVEHSTGALGHGLSVAVGMAIGLKARKSAGRVYVVLGDGEMQEGSNWEALMLAGHLGLDNLSVLVDGNCLGGIACVADCCTLEPLPAKFEAFNFAAHDLNGHDLPALTAALDKAEKAGRPAAFVCRTVKGKGVSFMEGQNVWHYRPPNKEAYDKALAELNEGKAS